MFLPSEPMSPKQGYRIGRAAGLLRVPIPTLRYWIDKGKVAGFRSTAGGHRWITRKGLLQLAKLKGLSKPPEDRRRAPRVQVKNIRLRLRTLYKGQELLLGEGRLVDLSRTGFRMDRVKWVSPLVPATGTRIAFEVPHEGIFEDVAGLAQVAWHVDNHGEQSVSLGAHLRSLEGKRARQAWTSMLAAASH